MLHYKHRFITITILALLIAFIGCQEKTSIPTVTTHEVTSIEATQANCGGNVTDDGGLAVSQRGVCWSTSTQPTITDSFIASGNGTGAFVCTITNLEPGETYYVRAYATNSDGTAYGNEVSFKTLSILPSVTTAEVSSITTDSAISGGSISSDGGSSITARGVCWSTVANPTISDSFSTDGEGTGDYSSNITGLSPGTTYHIRAYATNEVGTAYGENLTFTTIALLPTVTTNQVSQVTEESAVCGGNVTSDGGSAVTARGVCWSTSESPTINDNSIASGSGNGSYYCIMEGLNPTTTYYVRAYATNTAGTAYGEIRQFTTLSGLPTVTTSSVTSITSNSAVGGGNVTSDGGSVVTARGLCWSTSGSPTTDDNSIGIGSGNGSYYCLMEGLSPATTYFVRAFAINTAGTAYGETQQFTTLSGLPIVTTSNITSITTSSAIGGGDVVDDGGTEVTARGICWSTLVNPTLEDATISCGTGTGAFTCSIEGLTAETIYYVRAYATNSNGTSYGESKAFVTLADIPDVPDNDHMLLGNPSGAVTSTASPDNYLMIKPQYNLSYSNIKLTANWASWHLYLGDIGDVERQDDFRPDNTLPAEWYWVDDSEYSGSGFDRGHLCPSADRTLTIPDNSATFVMTNMIPQAPNNNRITWANLEEYCRDMLDYGNELFIVAGPYGQGGSGSNGFATTVGNGVVVPSKTWKIIVVIPNGDNDLARITIDTRVIAVIMPNDQTCNSQPWGYYRVSVDHLEELTGYDFLSNVPVSIQEVLEETVDSTPIY